MAGDDKYYIKRCLDGHPEDFRHLVRRYQAILLANLSGQLGNKDIAEEAAQETFVRAYFSLEKLRKHGSFYSWLAGIANNVAKEQLRNQPRHLRLESIGATDEQGRNRESRQDWAVEKAIAQLPDKQSNIILLKYYGGFSCAEIAKQLDMPIGSVTVNLSRAYAQLRKLLERQNEKEVTK